ncbi:MAG: Haloacid dehalogenase-like hydrolase domain-containing 5 [Geoglossum simile]|nr:MAG: Haloacid dehalogenase-like hydrolase domain-containing 5 [Geoglossum simile]
MWEVNGNSAKNYRLWQQASAELLEITWDLIKYRLKIFDSDFQLLIIDGVLLRSSKALPRARKSLAHLQEHNVPFILLTNGGGKLESERVDELSRVLGVPLDVGMFVQSHTPFGGMVKGVSGLGDKCVLVVGGDGEKCRRVAEIYGFQNVITPGDIAAAYPEIWPFGKALLLHYKTFARPLPKPIAPNDPSSGLQVSAILVFNDSRDWGLDATVILDLLLSSGGVLGTSSPLNNRPDLPNRGFQQDGQPPIYFSNPDLLWAAAYHLPRLGQGGFRAAVEGVWEAVTGGRSAGVTLQKTIIGKPSRETFLFAETQLRQHREAMAALNPQASPSDAEREEAPKLHRVYMVGDNPESDIRGANEYLSPWGSQWLSILVRTGVYSGADEPARKPRVVVDDVWDAVRWGLQREGWDIPTEEK